MVTATALLLAARLALALPHSCNGPDQLQQQVRTHPSAKAWGTLGAWFEHREQYPCAIAALQNAVHLDPQSAQLHYVLGIADYAAQNLNAAIDEFKQSLALDPHQASAQLALGSALHKAGKLDQAESAWQTALQLDPSSVTALDWLAKARIERQDGLGAIELLQSAPPDEDLTLDLALALTSTGDTDEAAAVLQTALKAQPDSLRIATALATVDARGHRYEAAIAVIKTALAAHPNDEGAELLELRLLILKGDNEAARPLAQKLLMSTQQNFDSLYLSGLLERDAQDYVAADQHLRRAIALNPNHYDARYNLGLVLLRMQQPQPALEQLQAAILLDPSQAEAYFQLAQVLKLLGRLDESKVQFSLYQQKTQEAETRDLVTTKSSEAAQALKQNDAARAVELYREAMVASPADARLQYRLAQALDRTGDYAAERSALEKALTLDANTPEAENQLGVLQAKDGDGAAAQVHFKKALRLAPHYAEASLNLGTLLGQQGNDREAELQFREALASHPRSVQGWTNLSATLASEGRYGEARECANNAIRIDPADQSALQILRLLASGAPATGPVH